MPASINALSAFNLASFVSGVDTVKSTVADFPPTVIVTVLSVSVKTAPFSGLVVTLLSAKSSKAMSAVVSSA